MYIVGCRRHPLGHQEEDKSGYLIGILIEGEQSHKHTPTEFVGDLPLPTLNVAFDAVSSIAAGSEVGTALTGAIFRHREGDPDVARTLDDIRKLGKKEHWLIDTSELKLFPDKVLGEGGFGLVMQAEYHGAAVAMKVTK